MTTAADTDNRKCIECGADISHLRSDAKCCSALCRKKYNRRKDNIKRLKLNALLAINAIEKMMTDDDLEAFGRQALADIAKVCDVDVIRNEHHRENEMRRMEIEAFLESRKKYYL